ncbi:hypothetical protein BESB_084210 [Besnoitia besnoiti]|uniref:Uncharacterized protein n=1 Tax=Besnoitia besnoiti TaxID=94643 RepID=A0A2A9MCW6_BESBE|nr:hypothetical protein BESB_084210 [Besnoitia besnoiti]PFH33222.1 hypothetical protein BESB_084210 [Besnoitia besnoiti]
MPANANYFGWQQFMPSTPGLETRLRQTSTGPPTGSLWQQFVFGVLEPSQRQEEPTTGQTSMFNWQRFVPAGIIGRSREDQPALSAALTERSGGKTASEDSRQRENLSRGRRLQSVVPLVFPSLMLGVPGDLTSAQQMRQWTGSQAFPNPFDIYRPPLRFQPFQVPLQAPLMPLPEGTNQQLQEMKQRLQQMQQKVDAELRQQLEPQLQREYTWRTAGGGIAHGRFGAASASAFQTSQSTGKTEQTIQQQPQWEEPLNMREQQYPQGQPQNQTPSPPPRPTSQGGPPVDLLSSLMNDLERKEIPSNEGGHSDSQSEVPELLRLDLLHNDLPVTQTADRRTGSRRLRGPAGSKDDDQHGNKRLQSEAQSETNSDHDDRNLQGRFSWRQFVPHWTEFIPPIALGRHDATLATGAPAQPSNDASLRQDKSYEQLIARQQQLEQEVMELRAKQVRTDAQRAPPSWQMQADVGVQAELSQPSATEGGAREESEGKLQELYQKQVDELKMRQREQWGELRAKWKEEMDDLKQRHREQSQQLRETQRERAREQAERLRERQEKEWKELKQAQAAALEIIRRHQADMATRLQHEHTSQLQQLLAQQREQLERADRLQRLQNALKEQQLSVDHQLQGLVQTPIDNVESLIHPAAERSDSGKQIHHGAHDTWEPPLTQGETRANDRQEIPPQAQPHMETQAEPEAASEDTQAVNALEAGGLELTDDEQDEHTKEGDSGSQTEEGSEEVDSGAAPLRREPESAESQGQTQGMADARHQAEANQQLDSTTGDIGEETLSAVTQEDTDDKKDEESESPAGTESAGDDTPSYSAHDAFPKLIRLEKKKSTDERIAD